MKYQQAKTPENRSAYIRAIDAQQAKYARIRAGLIAEANA